MPGSCFEIDKDKLKVCLDSYIFNDPMMRETNMEGIVRRVKMVFHDRTYQRRLKTTDKKWMDDNLEDILNGLLIFLENCEK